MRPEEPKILFQRGADFSTHVVDFDLINLEPRLSVDSTYRSIDRAVDEVAVSFGRIDDLLAFITRRDLSAQSTSSVIA